MSKIICVVPTIRPESMERFKKVWAPLFEKHKVTLITVWDGEVPSVTIHASNQLHDFKDQVTEYIPAALGDERFKKGSDLFYRFTDACRNIGFVAAAPLMTSPDDVLLTMDDDVEPCTSIEWDQQKASCGHMPYRVDSNDPIQAHIDTLNKRVPLSWMNTAHDTELYLRGVPYSVRDEAPVMLSHGVWVGTPDFDGETQLRLEGEKCGRCLGVGKLEFTTDTGWTKPCPMCNGTGKGRDATGIPYSLPYYVGPIPRSVLFPLCGMNVAIKRDALPYFYFAPMGPDTGIIQTDLVNKTGRQINKGEFVTSDMVEVKQVPALNRFGDIWMGISLKKQFDALGWACYTGASTVYHARASDARKNFEQEKLGREWNERIEVFANDIYGSDEQANSYFRSYADKRTRFATLIKSLIGAK